MAFFKFRTAGGVDAAPSPAASESVQALRKRARHRLIGATVLVLVGVIGFPLVFDNQPRPIAVDIPIEIPDKNKVKPLGAAASSPATGAAAGTHSGAVVDESAASKPAKEEVLTPSAGKDTASAKASAKEAAKEAPKPVAEAPRPVTSKDSLAKDAPKDAAKERKDAPGSKDAVAKDSEAAKAQALLEGREPDVAAPAVSADPAHAAKGRFVVQVGSFVDLVKAREARMKMERAGFKTYTQEVALKDGKRLRVRVGPFESRAQAEKAAAKAKSLELSGAILEL